MTQRLDNNERTGKADITELYAKIKRETELREIDVDDLRNMMKNDRNTLEEKILKEKSALGQALDQEALDMNERIDKVLFYSAVDVAWIQTLRLAEANLGDGFS